MNKILNFDTFSKGPGLNDPKKHALDTKKPTQTKEKALDQVKRANLNTTFKPVEPDFTKTTDAQPADKVNPKVKSTIMEALSQEAQTIQIQIDDIEVQKGKLDRSAADYATNIQRLDQQKLALIQKLQAQQSADLKKVTPGE